MHGLQWDLTQQPLQASPGSSTVKASQHKPAQLVPAPHLPAQHASAKHAPAQQAAAKHAPAHVPAQQSRGTESGKLMADAGKGGVAAAQGKQASGQAGQTDSGGTAASAAATPPGKLTISQHVA